MSGRPRREKGAHASTGQRPAAGDRPGTAIGTRSSLRCAIYTRKSSDEGLEQSFNSLDAQYEACAAYVASQRHEGWKLIPARYDDGGLSGGTLERPALQRLLADIDAGRVGMVIIYKVDRLTRSLADFTRLVERFDRAGCSFVSVTQSFNTSTSMGRLTLNVLLSFAQFEREVTGERIRDKIAASKKKGMWLGGMTPLGYDRHPDPQRRELVEAPEEAEEVRRLFRLYDEHGCLRTVADAAEKLGLRSKPRTFSTGRTSGGLSLSRGQLHYLLTNPVYRGMIRHRDQLHEGAHPAIIGADLWDRVQAKLQVASGRSRGRPQPERTPGNPAAQSGETPCAPGALLTGKLRDEAGDPLTPTHTQKDGKRYRYYVSHRLLTGDRRGAGDGWRLPAEKLEQMVARGIAAHLGQAASAHRLLLHPEAGRTEVLEERVTALVGQLTGTVPIVLHDLVAVGQLAAGRLHLDLRAERLAHHLQLAPEELAAEILRVDLPLTLRRRGVELRLVAADPVPAPDAKMLAALARAHRWTAELRRGVSLATLAAREHRSEALIRTRCSLAFLSPSIQQAIIEGQQPPGLTLERLIRSRIPHCWVGQERQFGFR